MPDSVDLSYAIGLKPAQAIEYFQSKGYNIGFNWHEVEARAHATAFTVAGILRQDIDNFPFTFVAPLGADDDEIRHCSLPLLLLPV